MYVAKIYRKVFTIEAIVFEKVWEEKFSSNSVTGIGKKKFLSRRRAQNWINSEICKNMFKQKRLEIIDE